MNVGTLAATLEIDEKPFKQGLDRADQRMGESSAAAGRMGNTIRNALLGAGFLAFGNDVMNVGAQLENVAIKSETVFEGMAGSVREWADSNNEAFGMTDDQLLGLAASFGDLMKPMGFTSQQAADMSTNVLGLAGALADWSGGQRSAAEVAEILQSAMLGEREALKGLGISITEADVQARLAAKGQTELTGAALQQAQAIATQELIFEKSTDAQKAWADGGNQALRAQNELKASVGELREQIATGLLPAGEKLVGFLADAAGMFAALPGPMQTAAVVGIGFALAWGPVAGKIKDVANAIDGVSDKVREFITTSGGWGAALSRLGPWLAAVGPATLAAGVALIDYNRTKEEAARISGLYAEAIAKETGALEDNVDAVTAAELAHGEFGGVLRDVRADYDALNAGVRDQGEGIEYLEDHIHDLLDGYTSFSDIIDRAGLSGTAFGDELLRIADAGDLNVNQLIDLMGELDGLSDRYDEQTVAAEDAAYATEAAGTAAEEATPPVTDLAAAQEGAATAGEALADAIHKASDAIARMYGETLTALQADVAYQDALDGLTASIHENGATLDTNTEKGRANIAAATDAGTAIADLMGVRLRETGSLEGAHAAGLLYVENLRQQLRDAGLTEAQVQSYIDTLNLTPEDVMTLVDQVGAEQSQLETEEFHAALDALPPEKRTQVQALIDQGKFEEARQLLDDLARPRTVTYNVHSVAVPGGPIPRFHSGGVVPGAPGQEVLALLRAGEIVINPGAPGTNVGAAAPGLAAPSSFHVQVFVGDEELTDNLTVKVLDRSGLSDLDRIVAVG